MNSPTSPVRKDQEGTTQRSDGYSVGQAATVISATGKQARGIPTVCECGRELVCVNGELHCSRTLEIFAAKHGYAYGSARAKT